MRNAVCSYFTFAETVQSARATYVIKTRSKDFMKRHLVTRSRYIYNIKQYFVARTKSCAYHTKPDL